MYTNKFLFLLQNILLINNSIIEDSTNYIAINIAGMLEFAKTNSVITIQHAFRQIYHVKSSYI